MKVLYTTEAIAEIGSENHVATRNGAIDNQLSIANEIMKVDYYTHPEDFFAAGYAASFARALREVANGLKIDLKDYTVTAQVSLENNEDNDYEWGVILDVYLPGQGVEAGGELLNEAHDVCAYSRATMDNIEVTLNLLLDD